MDVSRRNVVEFHSRGTASGWVKETVVGAMVCTVCFEVRGRLRVNGPKAGIYDQQCACEREAEAEKEPRWPNFDHRWFGFDFNQYLDLCHCCAIEPLHSGSRWSPFFCRECKERVVAFNRRCGEWVIPIGRHSMMHGDFLQGSEAQIEEHVEHFVAKVQGLFARIEHLEVWARALVEENLKVLGFPAGEEIELSRYLEAGRQLDKATAFKSLCEHFAAP